MKTTFKTIIMCALVVVLAGGCSNRWREGSAGISDADLMERLDEVTASSSGGSSLVSDLAADELTAIYFAEGPGAMGPAHSVLSTVDLTWLGLDQELSSRDLQAVTVF